MNEAWFSALGEPLDEGEMAEVAAYLEGLGFSPAMPLRPVADWREAAAVCQAPSDEWWRADPTVRKVIADDGVLGIPGLKPEQ